MSWPSQLEFTRAEIEAFTCGDCGYLALALHAETGWTPVTVSPVEARDTDFWYHVAVQTPDGLLVDIRGTWTTEEFLSWWASENYEIGVYPRDTEWITESVHKRPPKFPEYAAGEYARLVLEQLATHHKDMPQGLQLSSVRAIV